MPIPVTKTKYEGESLFSPFSGQSADSESGPNEADDDAWFYLRVEYDEAIFNHDPEALGRVDGDPDYDPLENFRLVFFKVRGEVLAQRLVRLFDRGVKPNVEEEGERRVHVLFSLQRVDAFDEDAIFLIEEKIASARAEVERLDQEWRIHTAPRKRARAVEEPGDVPPQQRPLSGPLLSYQGLYDQAQRWCEKLEGGGVESSEEARSGQSTPADESVTPNDECASDVMLRVALPTAVMAAAGLRDLSRVRAYYPDVIPEEEAKALHEALAANLKSAAEICKLDHIFEITKVLTTDEIASDMEISALMGMLALHHPDVTVDPSSRDAVAKQLDEAIKKCQQDVMEPVRGILERVQQAMLYDCHVPCPKGDDSFQEPQRFLQMLRAYWTVIRKLVLHHIDAPISYRPHPLLPLVNSFKARIDESFNRLNHLENAEDVHQQVASLVDIVLSGAPDDLSVVTEWSYDQVEGIDRFIEEARLALGAKSYPLTPTEEMCLGQAQKAVDEYEGRVKEDWAKMLRRMDARHEKNASQSSPQPQPTTPNASATAEQPPEEPTTFRGGELVFSTDRVTICGAHICGGPRCGTRRRILDVLKTQRDGKFVGFSTEEIAIAAQIKNGAKAVPGVIRALRDDIVEALRGLNISSGRFDVILTDKYGYHFAACISVQTNDEPDESAITDMDSGGNVRNADGEPNDVPNVPDDATSRRKAWILRRLEEGHRLKGPDVTRQFACSNKTAQRDLAALKDEGRIEFVGATRTGYYRLCQDPDMSD